MYVFRKLIWVLVPISSCFFPSDNDRTAWFAGWKVTVISSNFIAYAYFNNGNEHSYEYETLQLRENFPEKYL